MWKKAKPAPPFDNDRWLYERVVKHCYGGSSIALAMNAFKHFTGFNWEDGLERRREEIVNSNFEIFGVLYESLAGDRHVKFAGDLSDVRSHHVPSGTIGGGLLTGMAFDANKRIEERDHEFHFSIDDPSGAYRAAIQSVLRDAALSGDRFTHVELMCEEPPADLLAQAMAQLSEKGYGPHRRFISMKMWPALELPNTPDWARRTSTHL